MHGAGARFKREQRNRAWLAWQVANLSRAERMPSFATFAGPDDAGPRTRRQTPDELQQNLEVLVAALGGKKEA